MALFSGIFLIEKVAKFSFQYNMCLVQKAGDIQCVLNRYEVINYSASSDT